MPKRKGPSPSSASPQGAMMSIDQAWERVGKDVITKQGLYLAATRGDFVAVRLGRRVLVPRAAFEKWLRGGAESTNVA